jgi:hypothetical protein
VLRRTTLPSPGRVAAYALTGRGEALMPILAGLAEWGAGLEDPPPSYTDRTAWSVVAMRPTAPGEAARFDTLTELVVGEEKLWLQGDGERLRVETGPAPVKPKLRLICDHQGPAASGRRALAVSSPAETAECLVSPATPAGGSPCHGQRARFSFP